MRTFWKRQLDYSLWANKLWLDFLRERIETSCGDQRLLAHIVAAEGIWLARVLGKGQPGPVWPEWSLEEISLHLEKGYEGYGQLIIQRDDDLSRSVAYTNTQGEPFSTTLIEILHHVALHGAYHRGQMATKAREAGQVSPSVDFITFVREGH